MFLTRLFTARRREDGAALVSVIAVVAITAIVGITISTSVIAANGYSTSTRADIQARAAADAGIDATFARIYAGQYVCSSSASGALGYTATVSYKDAAGGALSCSGTTVLGVPATATITAVGTAQAKATQGESGNTHTVRATLSITPAQRNGDLDKAVFSESGFTLTNNNQLIESSNDANDANVYSNGTVVCKTQVDVEGVLYSQGAVSLENSCTTNGSVWAAGAVTFSSQAIVRGDVYSAGTGTVDLSTGHVDGSIITNGSVTMSNNSGVMACPSSTVNRAVCGSVIALGGTIYAGNGASIGGSAYAKSTVTLNNFNGASGVGGNVISLDGNFANDSNSNQAGRVGGSVRVGGNIGGFAAAMTDTTGSCQKSAGNGFAACVGALSLLSPSPAIVLPANLGYPTTGVVNKPPREQMPRVNSGTTDLAAWLAEGWTITTFNASTASAAGKTSCQQAKDFAATSPTGKNLIVVRDCATPISWDNSTLTLKGDLAIISNSGFKTNNVFTITSDSSTLRGLMFIVPGDASYVTWTPVTGTSPLQYTPSCGTRASDVGDIRINNLTVNNVAWLAYTPCYLGFQNQLTGFLGQLYGGSVNYPNNSTIQLVKFNVPGVSASGTPASSTAASATILTRTDVSGG